VGLHSEFPRLAPAPTTVHARRKDPAARSVTITGSLYTRRIAFYDPAAFEPNGFNQSIAACRSENAWIIIPRFQATSAANPVTAGELPIIATLTAIDRVTQYSTIVFPRMNLSVAESSPSTAQQSNRTFPQSAFGCGIADILPEFHCVDQRYSPRSDCQQDTIAGLRGSDPYRKSAFGVC
jgi:hypothetical protein